MSKNTRLTQAIIHELLIYDPFTGTLTWRHRDRKWFKSDRQWKTWNARYADKPAFTYLKQPEGYAKGCLFYRSYRRSRIIFLYMTGRWPNPEVDHENRKPADDCWTNLREVTYQQNNRNVSLQINNTSGRVGVRPYQGRYRANIGVNGRQRFLGDFRTFEAACAAREAAEREHGFSLGHGRRRLIRSADQTMH